MSEAQPIGSSPEDGEIDYHQAYEEFKQSSSPEITSKLDGGEFVLTWQNTVIYQFEAYDGMFDHMRHRDAEGSTHLFKVPAERLQGFIDAGYGRVIQKLVDESTFTFVMRQLSKNMDEGLDKFMNGD